MEIPPILRLRSAQIFLLWTAIICIACYHIHDLTVSLPITLRYLVGLVVGVMVVFFCHLSYWRRERIHKEREAYSRQMISLEKKDLFRLLPEHAANSAARKQPDQFEWLNVELAKVWPFLNEAVAETVRNKLQPVLDQYKMGLVEEYKISSLSFGVTSPRFLGVKMEEMGEDEASVEADLRWRAERENIVIKVKTAGPDFEVKVGNISVSATAKIVLKPLVETMPCFGAIMVSLSGIPVIDFDLKIAAGDANALPGVAKMIDNSIRTAIEDMLVWPNRMVCPVLPGDFSFLELKPVGILDVTLIKAEGVMNTDILGKSDCFVVLFVRKKPERIKRSSTRKNSLNPVWNEGFRIEVDDPQYQSLTVQLMDEESASSADYIGRAVIPMSDFEPLKPRELWLDMVESTNLRSNKPRARLHIMAIYEPFKNETSPAGSQETVADGSEGGSIQKSEEAEDPQRGDEGLVHKEVSGEVPKEIEHKEDNDANVKQTT